MLLKSPLLLKIHTDKTKSISHAQIRREDPKARAETAATTPATKDGETAAAGDVGLGAGASAAEMTATSTDITAMNIALEKAIGVIALFLLSVLRVWVSLGSETSFWEEVKMVVYIEGGRRSYGQFG
ncbi:unnamed protein product [Sphenostylis stenocarpa]|uniref:Uncharacterized protein n=1 Tax=Sphenostylis stenocarpa TaxID=92480 RepID=A0AA86T1R8_9FABA|nr:unnamed protein product [Sphenostylis stenocarpa]